MEKDLFTNLKKHIGYYLPEVKTCRLWNEQIIHSNGVGEDGRNENAFQYPAVFLQLHSMAARDLSLGIQEFDMIVSTYLCFKSLETDDDKVLDLKERLYWVCQRFQQGNFARLSRIAEEPDNNHGNVQVFKTDYRTRGMDDFRYVFGEQTLDYITGVTVSDSLVVLSAVSQYNIYSGTTSENGVNEWVDGSKN
jgi:hypothetical protein